MRNKVKNVLIGWNVQIASMLVAKCDWTEKKGGNNFNAFSELVFPQSPLPSPNLLISDESKQTHFQKFSPTKIKGCLQVSLEWNEIKRLLICSKFDYFQ